jgi:hypothetical protein
MCATSFLKHDDDSTVIFETLEDYSVAARSAINAERFLEESHWENEYDRPLSVTARDQDALTRAMEHLLEDEDDEDAVALLLVYIQTLDLSNMELLERLVRHPDMYVVEAVGDAITRLPRSEVRAIATMVSEHEHPQVAAAGKRALSAIKCGS